MHSAIPIDSILAGPDLRSLFHPDAACFALLPSRWRRGVFVGMLSAAYVYECYNAHCASTRPPIEMATASGAHATRATLLFGASVGGRFK